MKGKSPSTTDRTVDLLEKAGRYEEAIQACLKAGDRARAAQILAKAPGVDRVLAAQVHLAAGRPVEAGHLFAAAGLTREAAAAFEAGNQWAWAASRWESVRDYDRAAEVYRRANLPREASRCLLAARKPLAAATVLQESGDRTGAAQILIRVEAEGTDALAATALLIPMLLDEKLYQSALDRIVRLPPQSKATARDRLGWEARAREGMGQLDAADALYRKLLQLVPGDPFAQGRRREIAAALEGMKEKVFEAEKLLAVKLVSPLTAPPPIDPPGLALGHLLAGRYELQSEIGHGGMGRVYKAYDRELGGHVAIKTLSCVLDNDRRAPERLLREVQIGRRLDHPNVVRVFDFGRFEGGLFLILELLDGKALDHYVSPDELLPLARVRTLLEEIAAGLAAAHAAGVVHRDLKPSNLMVTSDRLKILDFGIAHLNDADRRLTQTGFALGSVLYMSPEQLQGQAVDHRVDLYSLGVVAHALLTGTEPFDGTTPTSIALQHLQKAPPDPRRERPDLPESWVALVGRLLAKAPEDRYQTAREVLEALQQLPVPAAE